MKASVLMPVAMAWAFSGCIQYEEETWIEKDRSGKTTFSVAIPQNLADSMANMPSLDLTEEVVRAHVDTLEGLELVDSRAVAEDGQRKLITTIRFSDFARLEFLNNSKNQADMMGVLEFSRLKNGNVLFERTVSVNLNDAKITPARKATMRLYLRDSEATWRYKVHFPFDVLDANAPKRGIDSRNNTVSWEFPLSLVSEEPQHMWVELKEPGTPAWVRLGVLGVVAVLGVIIFAYRAVRRRKRIQAI